ncbi:MAG: 1,4-dihydroxy-2-naphthoate octaprenyltransferase, partial [Bacteroidales bacterium]|nr:1,4-dihydroxy-2-naphthoate octaprenyltransferase [Bacteroidales bacterium]
MTVKSAIKSMRLRTLPLSLSGVVYGIFLAASVGPLKALTVVFLLITASMLQVLSNLSNELGDTLQGTDDANRTAARYSLIDGEMTIDEMKKLIIGAAAVCCIFGTIMVWSAVGTLFSPLAIVLLALGTLAIGAAMLYTLGKHPYGYRGFGDLSVFIFFGLVSCCGSFFVCTLSLSPCLTLLPACAIGFFSVGVLNLNNIRDMKSDARTRTTVAIKLGPMRARIYQTILICGGWAMLATSTVLRGLSPWGWLYCLTLPLFIIHMRGVWAKKDSELDPYLPILIMGTFALSILAGTGSL